MPSPREIEVKLECDAADLVGLARHPLLQAAEPATDFLDATYFDTAHRDLHGAKLSLRLRRNGERIVQTLKAASTAAVGLFDRPEWEWEVPGPMPDTMLLDGTPAAAILSKAKEPEPRPLFRTIIERSTREIRHGASRIVVTLDAGRVETENGDVPISEIELELAEGVPADLFAVARLLSESAVLRLGVLSKGERGFALVEQRLRKPSKARTPALADGPADGIAAGEAFARIAMGCLHHLRLNETVFLHGRDPEALHQMRVALRRLRSAFTLFKAMLRHDATAEHLRREIKRVTEPFGTARNLDVFLSETLRTEIERRLDEPGLHELRERLTADRDRAYGAVLDILASPAWRLLLLDLVAWIEAGAWRDGKGPPHRDEPARAFAEAVLDRLRRRIRKQGRHLAKLEDEDRHQVRIEAKKLRYGAEFFAPLFPDKKAEKRHKAFVGALSDLQDHLGALNDLATAHEIAGGLVSAHDEARTGPAPTGAALFAAGLATADAEARAGRLLDKAEEALDELLDVRPFWR